MTLRLGDTAPISSRIPPKAHPVPPVGRRFLGGAVLPPCRFHAGLHHELGKTAALAGEFRKRGVSLIAVSVDPWSPTAPWVQDINETQDTTVNPHPRRCGPQGGHPLRHDPPQCAG
jgi:hypothetical protein